MTLTVASQTLYDGFRGTVILCTGTGGPTDSETNVVKVNVANLNPVGGQVKVWEIEYDTQGILVQVLWDATTPAVFANLFGFGKLDFHRISGAPNPKAPGFTGNILFSTVKPAGGGGNLEGIVDNLIAADIARGAQFTDDLDQLRIDTGALWSYSIKLRLKKTGVVFSSGGGP